MNDDNSSSASIAAQLIGEVEALAPGAKLPPQRELVRRFGASATTIAQALSQLSLRGLIETRPGAGTFRVAPPAAPVGDTSWQDAALELTEGLQERPGLARKFSGSALAEVLAPASAEVVDLNGGYLHSTLQPAGLLSASLTRVSRRPEVWERPLAAGVPALRDWFARDIGAGLTRHDVLICPGGQGALATTLRALTGPGDAVVVEAPTYPGMIAAAQAASLRPVPVPLDEDGIIPEHLDQALARSRARVVVLQPLHQNPTGVTMSRRRASDVCRVARDRNAFVVEDDFARHLTHSGAWSAPAPLIADDPDGNVVHIRSLTKVTSPNLRVAAIAARGAAFGRLQTALTIDSLLVPAVLQHTALEVVTAPGWRRGLSGLQTQLATRSDRAVAAVHETFGGGALAYRPHGGYHLWLTTAGHRSGLEVARAALAAGVAVTPGENYFAPGGGDRANIRISYVAAPTVGDVEGAIRRLGDVL